ncbi:MAG: hypothetical protein Fur002_24410 [Anaerolineales bacterium]
MKGGRRYPLVVYTHMLDRWRPWIFGLGLALLALTAAMYFYGMEQAQWVVMGSVGVFSILASFFMALIRKSAYAQPFPQYLRIATPFLRLNISYKRFRRTTSVNMGLLFPRSAVSRAQAEVLSQLASMTAILIDLNKLPMSQTALKFFLSPLFFKDKTPHIVILVEDWMRFSSDVESLRSGGGVVSAPQKSRSDSILSKLPSKK